MSKPLPRIALVAHGFPPHERTGVENHVASAAASLARHGADVEVFAACSDRAHAELDTWREERDGYWITRMAAHRPPSDARAALDRPGAARVFGAWLDEHEIALVHFHHVVKLGVGWIEEAAKRGLAIAYTAHDFYPVSSRYTLLAPDLTAIEPGDLEAEVRTDLALELLDRIERLGDYHGTVLPEQLEPDERASLNAVLHGDPRAAGFASEKIRAAGALRRELEIRRRAAFRRVDHFFAPTRFVADVLARAGFARAQIEVDAYGLDLAPFGESHAGSDPARASDARNAAARASDARSTDVERKPERLSFGYLGALVKHKGVHVLLDAFAGLADRARLEIHGGSHDSAYVALLAERAERVGARMHGAYEARDAARALADVDVLVVPSIWPENAPFVIREAFAAGRPVLASRAGALSESVREGVDGMLFDAGDVRSLRATIERCIEEPKLVQRLRAGIAPVRTIDDQTRGWIERYRELAIAKLGAKAVPLPAHLASFAARVRAIDDSTDDELGARVLRGLGALRTALLGDAASAEEVLAEAWSSHGDLADTLRAWEHERAWLGDVARDRALAVHSFEGRAAELVRELEAHGASRAALEKETAWLGELRAELDRKVQWLEKSVADKTREIEEKTREATWAKGTAEAKTTEAQWLQRSLEEASRRVQSLERAVAEKTELADRAQAELELEHDQSTWIASVLEGERAHRIEEERRRVAAEFGRDALERERGWLSEIVADRDREIAWRKEAVERIERAHSELVSQIAAERARVEALEAELDWRRSEMRVVQTAIREKLFPLVSRDLRWRARHWPEGASEDRAGDGARTRASTNTTERAADATLAPPRAEAKPASMTETETRSREESSS